LICFIQDLSLKTKKGGNKDTANHKYGNITILYVNNIKGL